MKEGDQKTNTMLSRSSNIVFLNYFILLVSYQSFLAHSHYDGGLDKQPYVFFVLLGVADIAFLLSVIWSAASTASFHRFENYEQMYNFFILIRNILHSSVMCLLLKMIFEGLLFVKLALSIYIPLYFVLIPLWTMLSIIVYDLTRRLHSIQQ
uniref:Transmembrane protein n=1 Tax=Heterorhabditis bacteriophora TaxID=37862 RepID=A0A1I7W674_HETBA